MAKQSSVRLAASHIVSRVAQGESLSQLLPDYQLKQAKKERALLAELCYGTLRYYFQLDFWLNRLIEKPLKSKEQQLHSLLLVGLYQLFFTRIPPHAAIGETVQVTRTMGKAWARGLVNGTLRSAQRQFHQLIALTEDNDVCRTSHPRWLIDALQDAWPQHWQEIVRVNNMVPPMTLRVNEQCIGRDRYIKKLLDCCMPATASPIAPQGVTLKKATSVENLPSFAEGFVSVQDESAQLAGALLPVKSGDRVLDACCAPGGKLCQLLEMQPDLAVDALDISPSRLKKVQENLDRLKLSAELIAGDGKKTDQWWNGEFYDHILLDAPCSATGVIRRHPDIKLLRRPEDLKSLSNLQGELLDSLWPLLKPGGTLLYITCSVMPEENSQRIKTFLARQTDSELCSINAAWGVDTDYGRQILPGSGDGFFYSLLRKKLDQ